MLLAAEGVDPDRPTISLAPFDHFHGRGLEATEELASSLSISPTDHILDVGSGIGGPARYFAHRFGFRITEIDLTPEFCEVARVLTRAVQGCLPAGQGARVIDVLDREIELVFMRSGLAGLRSDHATVRGVWHRRSCKTSGRLDGHDITGP
jgi:ubiquinone/menaquinone biosynthesis C-methylase UbiE